MTTHLLSLWDVIVTTFSVFLFIAYLFVLFQITSDLFRDGELSGLSKAIWVIFLICIPLFTSLVYLVFRGKGMTGRHRIQVLKSVRETDDYIRNVAAKSPARQIFEAKKLWDDGIITEDEFLKLKKKAIN